MLKLNLIFPSSWILIHAIFFFYIIIQIKGEENFILDNDEKIKQITQSLKQIEEIIDTDDTKIFAKINEFLMNKNTEICFRPNADKEKIDDVKTSNSNEFSLQQIIGKFCRKSEESDQILNEIFDDKFNNIYGELKELEENSLVEEEERENNIGNSKENILENFKKILKKICQKFDKFKIYENENDSQQNSIEEISNWLMDAIEKMLTGEKIEILHFISGIFSKFRNLYKLIMGNGNYLLNYPQKRAKRSWQRNLQRKNQRKRKRKMLLKRKRERRRQRLFIIFKLFALSILFNEIMDVLPILKPAFVTGWERMKQFLYLSGTQLFHYLFKVYGPF